MFSEDYIMRMIRAATAVIAKALNLRSAGAYREAHESIDVFLEEVVGLQASLFKMLDDEAAFELLTTDEGLDIDRAVIAADLMQADGDIYAEEGNAPLAQQSYQRALSLYLEAFFATDPGENAAPLQKLETLMPRLDVEALTPEQLFSLLAYDELLGNYPRAESWLLALTRRPDAPPEAEEELRAFRERRRG